MDFKTELKYTNDVKAKIESISKQKSVEDKLQVFQQLATQLLKGMLYEESTVNTLGYSGLRPFLNIHVIDDSVIIRNNIELNKNVANKVVVHAPSLIGGVPVVNGLWYMIEKFMNIFGSSNYSDVKLFGFGGYNLTVELVVDDDIPPDMINTAVHTLDFANAPQLRLLLLLLLLKQHLEEMYQGEIVIVGHPTIKPNDYIYLVDTVNKMYGILVVRRVTHIYNFTTGYVTSISIKPDISTRDIHLTSTAEHFFMKLTGTLIGTALFAFLPASKAGGYLAKFGTKAFKTSAVLFTTNELFDFHSKITAMQGNATLTQVLNGRLLRVNIDSVITPFMFRFLVKNGEPFYAGLKGYTEDPVEGSLKWHNDLFRARIATILSISKIEQ